MNFRKPFWHSLCLAVLPLLCFVSGAAAQNQTTPFQQLAREIVQAKNDGERDALLERNKDLQTVDLRKALVAEGLRFRVEGSYDKAIETDEFTARFAERIGDKAGVAAAVNNIGVDYQERGQFKTAIEYFNKSLELKILLKDPVSIAASTNNIGLGYSYLGEYNRAQEFLLKALKMLEEANRPDLMPNPLNNLGIVQRRLGNYARARDYYEQSLRLYEAAKNKYGMSLALSNLGVLKLDEGDFAASLEFNRKSLALREELGNKNGVSISLNNIGNIYLEQNDFSQALLFYEKQLKITEETKAEESSATALTSLANVKLKMRQPDEALDFARRAAAIAGKIGSEELLWNDYKIEGAAYRQLKQPENARKSLESAIKIIESRRSQLSGGAATQNYFSNKIEPYHEAVKLQVEQADFTAALDYAERAKSRALLDILSSEPVEIGKSLTAAEKSREQEINSRISLLNQQTLREKARAPLPDADRLKALENELEKTRLEYEAFRAGIYAAHPELQAQRGEAKMIVSGEIADLLLKEPGKALLEYVVTDEATYLFAITKAKTRNRKSPIDISVHKIPVSQKELTAKTDDFRRAIAVRGEYKIAARELYNLLVAPALAELKGKTKIVVVPDAALWNLPFQALINAQNRFLLEDYVLSYAPSLTALREMRKIAGIRAGKVDNEKTLLAFGNPVFAADSAGETQTNNAVLRGDQTLAPLPDAEKEVKSLADLYGVQRSRIYVKGEAREDRAKAESKNFRVVQFATHSVFNDANPLYSYLLLSPNPASGDDGLLEARELMNLNLSADLVVLSACETARGRVSAGEGLTGMTWALFVSGVPTTIASQWKVSSSGTTQIMLDFHRNLLRKGKSVDKAAALRQAELNFLRGGAFQHPFYWAGFVLIGSD